MASRKWNGTTITSMCIVFAALAIVSCLFYNPKNEINKPQDHNSTVTQEHVINTTNIIKHEKTKPILNPTFPRCHTHHIYTVLEGILIELYLKSHKCEGPKCKMKEKITTQNTGLIVAYAAVLLLLVSLLAAFIEVLKAKKDPIQNKSKPELSRRCSLADLTVLRHSRRESLMRRDSSLTIGESSGRVSLKMIGRKMSRPRLRVN